MLNLSDSFEPLDIGSIWTQGMLVEQEDVEEIEEKVRQLIADMKSYGLCVPAYKVSEAIDFYKIDYLALPQYLKNKIDDELEVY